MKYVGHSISFQTFFVQAFKIAVDPWKFSMLLIYILWDDWPIFMISDLIEQLQQELEYTLLNPDCHSWWISKMQSGREDTLQERYAIKLWFKLRKMPQKRMECLDCFWSILHDVQGSCFWLFPKLRGCRYETIEEMKEAVTKVNDMLTQEDFHEAFQK